METGVFASGIRTRLGSDKSLANSLEFSTGFGFGFSLLFFMDHWNLEFGLKFPKIYYMVDWQTALTERRRLFFFSF